MTKLGMSKFSRENSCSSVCTGCCVNGEESEDGEKVPLPVDSVNGLGIISDEGETSREFFIGSSLFSSIQPCAGIHNGTCEKKNCRRKPINFCNGSKHFVLLVIKLNTKQKHLGCKKRRGQSEAAVI